MTTYSIKMTLNGVEKRLGEERDCQRRIFFKTRVEAEQEMAFWKTVHRDAEFTIQEISVDERE